MKQGNQLAEANKKQAKKGEETSSNRLSPTLRPGNLIVLTGPSGVGKGTLTAKLLPAVPKLVKSVSVTTRKQRPGEQDGVDYFFRSKDEFDLMCQHNELMEHAQFAGNWYGTPRGWVDEQLEQGNDVLLEIEVQGANQVSESRPQSLLIFVSPPSFDELRARLQGRATETPEKIVERLEKAERELKQRHNFHYEVINDDIELSVQNLIHIVYAERCRIRKK
ncbi:MAG: guanylate kinase [Candidatus Obscuribacterales bacterium]|nr:guanylate kinase [Candidatus Obscuribacterales bacterium]